MLRSRKKYVEVTFKQWERLRYFDLKDYETARDEYEGTEYEVHKKDKYHKEKIIKRFEQYYKLKNKTKKQGY